MLIFWPEKLVLLATPKTGSTSIEAALAGRATIAVGSPPQLKHTGVRRYRRLLAPFLENGTGARFTVVALIREPVDWLGSWYRYRQREKVAAPDRSTKDMSFADFADAYMRDPQPAFAAVGSQARFLSGGNAGSGGKDHPVVGSRADDRTDGPDHLFRYEDMAGFTAFLEQRLQMTVILPRVNVSPAGDLHLPAEVEARLRLFLAPDLALYDSLHRGG